jgi:photosystem II stability/assembly factor-like uncharacterized protein
MTKTHTRTMALMLPALLLGTIQLSGCVRRGPAPPAPGGVYQSTSAGANFDQAVRLVDRTGELIGNIAEVAVIAVYRPPQEPSTLFLSAGTQGVFRSRDEGNSWQRVVQPLSAVTGLVQLENGVLLAGGTNADGEGIVTRSLDNGDSWERVLTIPALHRRKRAVFEVIKPPPPPPVYVSSIVIDQFNPDRVYATTSTGEVLISEQSGKLWSTLFRVQSNKRDPLTNRSIASIKRVIPSPHRTGELLLITTDGKLILVRDDEAEPTDIPITGGAVIDVTFIKQFPEALLVGTDRGVLFSRDRGQNWDQLDLPISTSAPLRNTVVRVSPTNPSRLIVAVDSVVYRSEDGGQTFNTLSLGLPNHVITDISINPINAARVLLGTAPVKS